MWSPKTLETVTLAGAAARQDRETTPQIAARERKRILVKIILNQGCAGPRHRKRPGRSNHELDFTSPGQLQDPVTSVRGPLLEMCSLPTRKRVSGRDLPAGRTEKESRSAKSQTEAASRCSRPPSSRIHRSAPGSRATDVFIHLVRACPRRSNPAAFH